MCIWVPSKYSMVQFEIKIVSIHVQTGNFLSFLIFYFMCTLNIFDLEWYLNKYFILGTWWIKQ